MNMVEFSKIDIMKNVKEDKLKGKEKVSKDKSFENVLNDRKSIEDKTKIVEKKNVDNVSEKEVKKLSNEEKMPEKVKSNADESEQIESIDNKTDLEINEKANLEDINLEVLMALLLLASSKVEGTSESINQNIVDPEKLMNLVNDKGFVNGVKETLNQFASEENFGKLNLDIFGKEILSEGLEKISDIKLPIKETFEKILNEIKVSDAKVNLSSKDNVLNNVKSLIVKMLNEKGLSDGDIKDLNMNLKLINTANEGSIANKDKLTNLVNQDLSNEDIQVIEQPKVDVTNTKMNQGNNSDSSSKESFNTKQGESKEDDFLSKLLIEDKSAFDLNLQRMKDFSSIAKVDSKVAINKETINMDIKNTVVNMTKVNMKEMVVKVNPGNLGEISIKLMAEADSMKAVIKVNSRETYALISAQDIKQHLANENIKISNVEIELYKEDTTFFSESNEFMSKDESGSNYGQSSKNEFMEFEDEVEEEITISSLDIII
ncbi:MAG: flagellar hook-length control protein FliK [Sarcina sp.]